MSPFSLSFPGAGISCETIAPRFASSSLPRPAPGNGLPTLLYPRETIGSGRLLSCVGRWRAASYFFWAAAMDGLFLMASPVNSLRLTRNSGICAGAEIARIVMIGIGRRRIVEESAAWLISNAFVHYRILPCRYHLPEMRQCATRYDRDWRI